MVQKLYAASCFALALTASAAVADTSSPQFHDVPEAYLPLVEKGVSARLLDPESAQISDIWATGDIMKDEYVFVCGYVQGKNAMGGYTPRTPFISSLFTTKSGGIEFLVIAIADQDAASQRSVLQTCRDRME